MKQILKFLTAGLCFLLFCSCNSQTSPTAGIAGQQQGGGVVEDVAPDAFSNLIKSGNGILLDVRTPEEIAEGYIEGASTIDFYDEEFLRKINLMQKDKEVYVYCRSGGRSAKTARMLADNGFKKIYNLKGGFMGWEEAGLPEVKPSGTAAEKLPDFSPESFQKLLNENSVVLADFHTLWCVPCKKMAPVVDEMAKQYEGKAKILRIDVDKCKEVGQKYSIQGVPVFILFKNGKEAFRKSGMMEKAELVTVLNKNL